MKTFKQYLTESMRPAPKMPDVTKGNESDWRKYQDEVSKWRKELESKAESMSKTMARMSQRFAYDVANELIGDDSEKAFAEFEKIYNDLDALLTKYKIKKN